MIIQLQYHSRCGLPHLFKESLTGSVTLNSILVLLNDTGNHLQRSLKPEIFAMSYGQYENIVIILCNETLLIDIFLSSIAFDFHVTCSTVQMLLSRSLLHTRENVKLLSRRWSWALHILCCINHHWLEELGMFSWSVPNRAWFWQIDNVCTRGHDSVCHLWHMVHQHLPFHLLMLQLNRSCCWLRPWIGWWYYGLPCACFFDEF